MEENLVVEMKQRIEELKVDLNFREAIRANKALASPTRLSILTLLNARGPLTSTEITQIIGIRQSTLSRHMSMLKSAGAVVERKDGKSILYSFDDLSFVQALGYTRAAIDLMGSEIN